jgi:hypothetical protein
MSLSTHELRFTGGLLERGFWLYVWEITTSEKKCVYYVGRTGDSSSSNAQSPFNRMWQHLGWKEQSNALRRQLAAINISPEKCRFRLLAHGPILPQSINQEDHRKKRDLVAAMEKALACAMSESGYKVINTVHCKKSLDKKQFARVRAAFARYLPNLIKKKAAVTN